MPKKEVIVIKNGNYRINLNEYMRKMDANLKSARRRIHNNDLTFKIVNNFNQTIKTLFKYSDVENNFVKTSNYYLDDVYDEVCDTQDKVEAIKKFLRFKLDNPDITTADDEKKLKEKCIECLKEITEYKNRYMKLSLLNRIEESYKKNEQSLFIDPSLKNKTIFMIQVFKTLKKSKLKEYKRFYKDFKRNVYYNNSLKGLNRSFKINEYCVMFNKDIMENRIMDIDEEILLALFNYFEKHIKVH